MFSDDVRRFCIMKEMLVGVFVWLVFIVLVFGRVGGIFLGVFCFGEEFSFNVILFVSDM